MTDQPLFEIESNSRDRGDLSGKYKHIWVEESLAIEPHFAEDAPTRLSGSYLGASINNKKKFWALRVMLVGLTIIIFRLLYLQLWHGEDYRDLAEGNRIRLVPITAERGIIFDRFNKEMVVNVPSFALTIVQRDLPRDLTEKEMVLRKLSEISDMPYSEIVAILKKFSNYAYESITIKEDLDHATAIKLYVQNPALPGIAIETGTKRYYPHDITSSTKKLLSSSHIIGYIGKLNDEELKFDQNNEYLPTDNIGKTGIEKFYEKDLRGKYGQKRIEVDAFGREQSVLAEESPIPGKNLYLTIDAEAQEKLEFLMAEQMRMKGLDKAAAVAMDPDTGAILAMVSLPSFDNNDFSGGIKTNKYKQYLDDSSKPLFARAIAGSYPSGSIIKPIVAIAALQEGLITKSTTVLSVGGMQVGRWFFKDWKAGGHGITNVTKALAWSVNTFFYYIGGGYNNFEGLGIERLLKYFRKFGLGQTSGIDIPNEVPGFLPTKEWKENTTGEKWYIGDTYNISIGQGHLLVTPIQAAVWTAAVANGGQLVWPHLGDYFVETNKKINSKIKFPFKNTNIVSSVNVAIAQQGMRECVVAGSCQLLNHLPFAAAGKTGTAQWSSTKDPHAWFTGFAPYNNPKIVITVLIEEGKEGSTVAQPIARDFLKWWGEKYLK
ncbi:MAG: penicillin-binding protein 2 [Candidatus Magasanikbacteria bacterium RIFOXYA2_FULL_44_8]|uniref:Penicillin-binding protein 2 n=1 Tax=Candidatus Magasanikbacteria bacterium RIFOXYA2_FULL_44_8 TaxID=1798696 RepID=A0A1F6NIA8_9BACT|nr:MAG: penicillin-binding protein 2 [Candidatus Magasanikbacteria bacterium RIFOXYA2_FULL_44_8]